MFKDIKKFFEEKLLPADEESSASEGIEYATAVLFIELAKADFEDDELEQRAIFTLLENTFNWDNDQLEELVTIATQASANANDLFQFTSLINQHYTNPQKTALLENFWRVAYADGRLDKYEEQFIRKVAGLINMPPSAFSKTKLKIKQSLET